MIIGVLALLVGFGFLAGFVLGGYLQWCSQREKSVRDPKAVTAAFNEWNTMGEVSAPTRRWLESGVRPQ